MRADKVFSVAGLATCVTWLEPWSKQHLPSCSSEEASSRLLHHAEAADDSCLQWSTPDEATTIPFSRRREDALELASQYDLCIGGDGVTHLHKTGADASFLPLAQVQHVSCKTYVCPKWASPVVQASRPACILDPFLHMRCQHWALLFLLLCTTHSLRLLESEKLGRGCLWGFFAGVCQGVTRSEGADFEDTESSRVGHVDVRGRNKRCRRLEDSTCGSGVAVPEGEEAGGRAGRPWSQGGAWKGWQGSGQGGSSRQARLSCISLSQTREAWGMDTKSCRTSAAHSSHNPHTCLLHARCLLDYIYTQRSSNAWVVSSQCPSMEDVQGSSSSSREGQCRSKHQQAGQ